MLHWIECLDSRELLKDISIVQKLCFTISFLSCVCVWFCRDDTSLSFLSIVMTDTAPSGCRWGWFGTTMMSSMPYTALSSKGTERRPFPRHWAQQLTRGRQSTFSLSLYQNTFIAVFKLPFLSPKSLATLTSAGQTLTLTRTKAGVG